MGIALWPNNSERLLPLSAWTSCCVFELVNWDTLTQAKKSVEVSELEENRIVWIEYCFILPTPRPWFATCCGLTLDPFCRVACAICTFILFVATKSILQFESVLTHHLRIFVLYYTWRPEICSSPYHSWVEGRRAHILVSLLWAPSSFSL